MFLRHAALFFFLSEAFATLYGIGKIGFFNVFLLWLGAAMIGFVLIQRQGMVVLRHAQAAFGRKAVPVDNMYDNICLAVAGFLFLLPGFISDILAVMLIIPSVRNLLKRNAPAYFNMRTAGGTGPDDSVIDGTYVRVEETVEAIEQVPPEAGPEAKD